MHELDTGRFDTSSVNGARALVVGGTTEIGKAVVHMLASLGAEVVATASDRRELETLLMDSERFGYDHVTGLRAALTSVEDRNRVFAFLDERWTDLDVLLITEQSPADVGSRGRYGAGMADYLRRSSERMRGGGAIFVVRAAAGTARPAHTFELGEDLERELDDRAVTFTLIDADIDDRSVARTLDPFDVATALLFCLIQPAQSDVVGIQMRPRRLAPI